MSLVLGAAALWTAGPALFMGWLPFWILLPTSGILASRWAKRWHREGDSQRWIWLATSGGALAWLSVVLLVPALLALPTMIRSRVSYNTSSTEREMRAVLLAEERYKKATGSFGTIECLGAPSRCGSGTAPPSLRPESFSLEPRFGFARYFYPGPSRRRGLESFAYLAVPLVPYREGGWFRPPTGDAALCADSTGRVCRLDDEATRSLREGRCPGPAEPRPEGADQLRPLPPCEPTAPGR